MVMHVCVSMHALVWMGSAAHRCAKGQGCSHVCMHVCAKVYLLMCPYISVCVPGGARTWMHTYVHAYRCVCVCSQVPAKV